MIWRFFQAVCVFDYHISSARYGARWYRLCSISVIYKGGRGTLSKESMRPGPEALLLNARLVLEVILDATAALWKNCRWCGLHTNCNKCDLIHDLYKVPQVPPVPMRVSGYLCLHRPPVRFSHLSLTKEAGRGQPRSRTQGTKKHQFHCAPFGPRSNPSNPSSHAAPGYVPSDSLRIPASTHCNAWTSTPWPATDYLLTCGNTSLSSQRPECWGHWRKHLEGRKEGPPRCRKSKSSVSEKWWVMKLRL